MSSLAPVCEALLQQARADAEATVAAARSEDAVVLAAAEREAAAVLERAAADRAAVARSRRARRLIEAHRQGQSAVLAARREAYEELRRRALATAGVARDSPHYGELCERLAAAVRAQLGAEARLSEPPEGGVRGQAGNRSVDYSLPALVDRCLQCLGGELEELWR